MYNNICIAQNRLELESIINLLPKNKIIYFIPLSLDTFLFCKLNNIKHINFLDVLDKNFKENLLNDYEEFEKIINFNESSFLSINIEANAAYRHTFNNISLIISILEKIYNHYNLENIYISGWEQYEINLFSPHNYYISEIIIKFCNSKGINSFILNKKIKYFYKNEKK